ncbi:hypothetical protein MNBD_ALPHA11-1886 [hydrothermal vent metagenome]|uniref:Uncharacterized protein n=1 Tax=hydrothermal vent metagenome TaxID=652676 RepID=A0A3B0ULX5_9ZZZZ
MLKPPRINAMGIMVLAGAELTKIHLVLPKILSGKSGI